MKNKQSLTTGTWECIFQNYQVSEKFIIENNNVITPAVLNAICKYQHLSKSFIENNKQSFNSIHRKYIYKYQHYLIDYNLEYNPKPLQ